jgi:hypothetical protein
MNKKILITPLLALSACSILSAQISIDFTSAEGYAAGDLNANADWGAPAGVMTVDPGGTGNVFVTVPSGGNNFQVATYVGSGSSLTGNDYTTSVVFSIDYSADTSLLAPGSNSYVGRFEYFGGGAVNANMRHMADGSFDLTYFHNINADNGFGAGSGFTAADIGLANDGSGWTDAVSDSLQLVHSLVYNSVLAEWTQTVTLNNLDTSTQVGTLARTFAEDDWSFRDADQVFRFDTGHMNRLDPAVLSVDSITVAVPEPSTYALMSGLVTLVGVLYRRRRR